MFKMNSFSLQERQLTAIRNVLACLAEVLDAPVSVELWDGSRVALGRDVHCDLRLAIRDPGVMGALLRWPTLDNLVRIYAQG
ncbi:MAG TPA: hypothetical protein VIK18_05670, partial [Pirellulales bacterium]